MSYSYLPGVDSKTGIGTVTLDNNIAYPMVSLKYEDDDYAANFGFILSYMMTPLSVNDVINGKFKVENGLFTRLTYGNYSLHVHVESIMTNRELFLKLGQDQRYATKQELKSKAAIQYADLDVHYDNYKNCKRFLELYKKHGHYFVLLMRENDSSVFYCCKSIRFDVDLDDLELDTCIRMIVEQYVMFKRHNIKEDQDSPFYLYCERLLQCFNNNKIDFSKIKKVIFKTCSFVKTNKYYKELFFVKNTLLKQATYAFLFRDELMIGLDDKDPVTIKTGFIPEFIFESLDKVNVVGIYSYVYPIYTKIDVAAVDKIGFSELTNKQEDIFNCKNIINEAFANRRYVLNPFGIRVKLKDDLVKEIIIREDEDGLRGYFITKDGNYFPIFYQYTEHFYYTPIQGLIYERTSTDPYLKIFLENWKVLITAQRSRSTSKKGKSTKLVAGDDTWQGNTIIYLPVRMTGDKEKDYVRRKEERKIPIPHSVSGHLRRTKHSSEKQIELAKKFGIYLPEGFTFVRPFRTGKKSEEE
jgi:hypothetical protein